MSLDALSLHVSFNTLGHTGVMQGTREPQRGESEFCHLCLPILDGDGGTSKTKHEV